MILPVHKLHFQFGLEFEKLFNEAERKHSISAAKINQAVDRVFLRILDQCIRHERRVSHPPVKPLEVPPGTHGLGITGRQLIQPFRL